MALPAVACDSPARAAKAVCGACNGDGVIEEIWLIWREQRGAKLVNCSRRVGTESEGWRKLKQLGPEAIRPTVLTGARPCGRCRLRAEAAANVTATGPVEAVPAGKPLTAREENRSGAEPWWTK